MTISLGGVELNLLPGELSWSLRAGTRPVQQFIELTREWAEELFRRWGTMQFEKPQAPVTYARGASITTAVGPLDLVMEGVTIKGLYVLGVYPGNDGVNSARVLVSDQRWLWSRVHVERSYNIPFATGTSHIVSGDVIPLEIAQSDFDVRYRQHSTDGGIAWNSEGVLRDVMNRVVGTGRYDLPPLGDLGELPIQGLRLRDPGDRALARLAGLIPGLDYVPTADGRIQVLNTLDGSEIRLAERLNERRWWGPGWRKVDLSAVRPQGIRVMKEQEYELRLDYSSSYEDGGSNVVQTPGREEPILWNVIQNPEPELQLVGPRLNEFVAPGSLVRFRDWLDAIEELADYAAAPGPLNGATIRRHYLNGLSAPRHYLNAVPGANDTIWSRRLSAVMRDWRRLFLPHPGWQSKVRVWRPVRAALLNPESGTRAQAQAWFDHTVKPSWRGLATRAELGIEVSSYAADLSAATPAPAVVRMINPTLGLMRIETRTDMWGNTAAIAPGLLDVPVPTASGGSVVCAWNQASIAKSWNLAVIVSVVADQPNDERRLYWQDIEPSDVEYAVDGIDNVGPCRGPPMEVFTDLAVARWAWKDSSAEATKRAIWDGDPMPEELLANPEETYGAALAVAAQIWAGLADRGQGILTVSMDGSVAPTGNAREVTHGVSVSGDDVAGFTRVVMPAPVVPNSVWSLLPEGARRNLMRLVQE